MSPAARWSICLTLLLGACIEPDYGPAPFLCTRTGLCPEGYRCVAGVCRRGASDMRFIDLPAVRDQGPDRALDAGPADALLDRDLPDLAPQDATPTDLPTSDAWHPPGSWKAVSKGSFQMGSPSDEPCRESDETQHKVTLTSGFWIMTTEVTQAMYSTIRGYLPAGLASCAACPVALVSWHEAAAYCNALSKKAGLTACYSCSGSKAAVSCSAAAAYSGAKIYGCPGYRLPTEAEWEYACRAGTTTALYNGPLTICTNFAKQADPIAWFSDNSGSAAHPVGKKKANAWGLYDMSGNVFEWCHDRYTSSLGSAAVTDPVGTTGADACSRGGSYGSWPGYLRSANRGYFAPGSSAKTTGLRCVRTRP